jgi:hypothetical protein
MKLKTLVIGGSGLFLMVFSLLLFVAILFSDEQDSGISNIHYGGVNVSAEVLAHKPMVEKYAVRRPSRIIQNHQSLKFSTSWFLTDFLNGGGFDWWSTSCIL